MKSTKKCEACGADMYFIQTKNGNWTPVDTKLTVVEKDDPSMKLVLSDGTIQKGVKRGDAGHTPHWATCTEPGRFRK